MGQLPVLALLDVAGTAARCGAVRLSIQYQRTDAARNTATRLFMKHAAPEDVLVMLDGDHVHPQNIVPALAEAITEEREVLGALYFRRSLPFDPVFYRINGDGVTDVPTSFSGDVEKCDIVGTGAIAIRRSALDKLQAAGYPWPFFRYTYTDGVSDRPFRSEDWQFGLDCKAAGIPHWVHTGLLTTHVTDRLITDADWFGTLRDAMADPAKASEHYAKMGMSFKVE